MDKLIFVSLSHTHYWYEVGMLKVPAVITTGSYFEYGIFKNRIIAPVDIYMPVLCRCSTHHPAAILQ